MTIYLKDGSIENCLSDEHKSEFWEDLIERRLGRDALTFYQDDILYIISWRIFYK